MVSSLNGQHAEWSTGEAARHTRLPQEGTLHYREISHIGIVSWDDRSGHFRQRLCDWVRGLRQTHKIDLEVVEHAGKGFHVVKHRWKVERTFGWLGNDRRHSRDDEVLTASSEAMIQINVTDFSVVLFRSDFMLASEAHSMKVHKNQWLLTLPSPPDLPYGAMNQGTPHGVWDADAFAVT